MLDMNSRVRRIYFLFFHQITNQDSLYKFTEKSKNNSKELKKSV